MNCSGAAQPFVHAISDHQGEYQNGCGDQKNADQSKTLDRRRECARKQDDGRNRAGARNQRNGEREDRDVGDVILRDRPFRTLLVSFVPFC